MWVVEIRHNDGIQHNDGFVRIELVGREGNESPCAGDVSVHVTAASHGFTGENRMVGLAAPDLAGFVEQLAQLEIHRQGEATLASTDPRELRLRLRSIDSLGHMAVDGEVMRHVVVAGCFSPHSVAFEFEFDPTTLPAVLAGFQRLQGNSS